MLISFGLIIVGFFLLILGANKLVDGASGIAKKFHIPEIIIGLTVVSIGTSMPELFVSITSAIRGNVDMAIGNVFGSNICNLLLILGLSSIMRTITFKEETRKYEIPICLFVTLIFILFCNTGLSISLYESIALLILFGLYIGYTIYMAKKLQNEETQNVNISENGIIKNIVFVLIGIIGLKIGGDLVVDNAVDVARHFELTEKIIGLTILAIGTSLPELVTSVVAAIKGNSDIAVGNVIGSNISNLLLIIGVASLISPIEYKISYNFDSFVLIIATLMLTLFPIIPPKNEMNKYYGVIYFLMYILYIVLSFII